MEMKVFTATGAGEIERMEKEVNAFMSSEMFLDVKFVNTALCTVGAVGEQSMVLTIFYTSG